MSEVVLMTGQYRYMNEFLHASRPSYGASGYKHAKAVMSLGFADILDYGCGKGTLKKELGFDIAEYDPAVMGKTDLPEPHDVVVCTDVLEHIEPDCIDGILVHLAALTERVAFLVIATRPANKTLPDGRNAHLIIQPKEWWLKKLERLFDIVHVVDDITEPGEFLVLATPKE